MNTDVLIIGAGAAGIRAALSASEIGVDVTVVANGPAATSGSTFSTISKGWGIQALVENELTEHHMAHFYDEIIRVGLGRCTPRLAHILVEESGPRLEDLLSFGLQFKKDDQGNYLRAKGCFSDTNRAFLTADYQNVKRTFQSILRVSKASVLQGMAFELIVSNDECWGARVLDKTGNVIPIKAKATILATGGGAGIFQNHFAETDTFGHAYALAFRAGAKLINMAFIQFMLGYTIGRRGHFLPLSALGAQGTLCDARGEDLIEKHISDVHKRHEAIENRQKHTPFSSRDASGLIDMAVASETNACNKVFWKSKETTPPLQVDHFAHAFNGGIQIDENAESNVPGLFAAGEAAAGPHGADRIGGCMMTATQVFGDRAGKQAAIRAKKIIHPPYPLCSPNGLPIVKKGKNHTRTLRKMKNSTKLQLTKSLGILRDEHGLTECLNILSEYQKELKSLEVSDPTTVKDYIDLQTILVVGKLITESALKNKTSIGSHFRMDHPGPHADLNNKTNTVHPPPSFSNIRSSA